MGLSYLPQEAPAGLLHLRQFPEQFSDGPLDGSLGLRQVRQDMDVEEGVVAAIRFEPVGFSNPPALGQNRPHQIVPVCKHVHPMQQPLDAYLVWLPCLTEPGDLMLDPFCGVGTMGVAC